MGKLEIVKPYDIAKLAPEGTGVNKTAPIGTFLEGYMGMRPGKSTHLTFGVIIQSY